MTIRKISILGGYGRAGNKDPVDRGDLAMGGVLSIVGPTGSGPIALITQHTSFLSDLPVHKFLDIHARIRHSGRIGTVVDDTLEFANQLTGEPIIVDSAMTELSGGQTRSLLIADAVIIGNSPIILLDEIENAGINKTKAIELLKGYNKIFVFVTHDPTIALFSDFRIIMKNGAMQKLIQSNEGERATADKLKTMDNIILYYRGLIRAGEEININKLDELSLLLK